MTEPFVSEEFQFEKEPLADDLIEQIMNDARAKVRNGPHPPTFLAVFGTKVEVYSVDTALPLEERNSVIEALTDYVASSKPKRVAYVAEEFMRYTARTDPRYKDVMAGKVCISSLPGSFRVLNITVQDQYRYWQRFYKIDDLPDGTRYPGKFIMGQDPYIPPVAPVKVQHMFFGPPPDTDKTALN